MTAHTDTNGGGRGRREAPPRLVYDDDCGFCTWFAGFAGRHGRFEIVGFGETTPDQRARLPDDWEQCVHLLTDDAVYSCGEATEQTLARMNRGFDAVFAGVRRIPGYSAARERVYRWGADRRAVWGRFLSGESP